MRSLPDPTRVTAGLGVLLVLLAACTTPGAKQPGRESEQPRPASSRPAPPASRAGAPIDVSTLPGRITFSNGTDDIWTTNADGTRLRRLTTNPAHDFDPAWSPDGRMIAFRSQRDGNNEIYVMAADGARQHNVSRDPHDDWGPTWSPTGQVLWNCAGQLTVGFHACVAQPDGSNRHRIRQDRYFEYGAWSPDGAKIAFMSQEPGAAGNDPNYNLYVSNADGSGLRQLTDAPGEDGFPSWSPEGTKIAFTSTRDDCANTDASDCRTTGDIGPYHTVYVMNADGSNQHRVSLQQGMLVDWSPDGDYLVFAPGLHVIRPDGSGVTSIPSPARPARSSSPTGPPSVGAASAARSRPRPTTRESAKPECIRSSGILSRWATSLTCGASAGRPNNGDPPARRNHHPSGDHSWPPATGSMS